MDAKQIASLKGSVPKPFTVTDAYELMSKKILINKISIASLQEQIAMADLSIKLQALHKDLAQRKIEIAQYLNGVLEQQLTEFTAERQEECLHLYRELNELDDHTLEYKRLVRELDERQQKILNYVRDIDGLERTIPNERLVTNFRVKPKLSANPTASCATEQPTDVDIDDYSDAV
jgi:hypothetical protein